MPANLSQGNCQYTALTTVGTTTINKLQDTTMAGSGTGPPSGVGVLYGFYEVNAGTSFGVTAYDIYVAGTSTTTTTLCNGTGTANQFFGPVSGGVGVRYRGGLVVVTSGTAGVINALWD